MSAQNLLLVPSSPFRTIQNFRDVGRTANLLQRKASVLPNQLVVHN